MILILYQIRTMNEHEMLKEICDTIGYDYSKRYNFYKTLKKF